MLYELKNCRDGSPATYKTTVDISEKDGVVTFTKIIHDFGEEAVAVKFKIENLYDAIREDGTLDLNQFDVVGTASSTKSAQSLNAQAKSLEKILILNTSYTHKYGLY